MQISADAGEAGPGCTVVDRPRSAGNDPIELPALDLDLFQSPASTIDAHLVSPSASTLVLELTGIPLVVLRDRPLEIELSAVSLHPHLPPVVSVARIISTHALLTVAVEVKGRPCISYTVPVSLRPSVSGWIARALIRPASWAVATSVTVVSLALAGRPLPISRLPATLRVGYNNAPAPGGDVVSAAKRGDVGAMQAALDAGGSTEEADKVREAVKRRAATRPVARSSYEKLLSSAG